jgi:hypothetical protein
MAEFYADEAQALRTLYKVRQDPWEFLKVVRTLDPVDQKNPVKKFPIHLDYIKLYVRLWQKEPMILVPKSRRMKMSWTNIALYTWDTVWHKGRHNAFVSKKEDDSDDLVKKAKFILDNLDLPREFIPKYECTYNHLQILDDLHSKIEGFASGADQLRQFTFSGILADELAFWDDAEKMYSSSVPTLEGGGRFTGISSPGPGFYRRLVFDQLDFDTGGGE